MLATADTLAGHWWQSLVIGVAGSVVALSGVIVTLIISGRREQRREQAAALDKHEAVERDLRQQLVVYERQRADRLRERRVEQFFAISAHVNRWGGFYVFERPTSADVDALLDERDSLSAQVRILIPEPVLASWDDFSDAARKFGVVILNMEVSEREGFVPDPKDYREAHGRMRAASDKLVQTLRAQIEQIDTT